MKKFTTQLLSLHDDARTDFQAVDVRDMEKLITDVMAALRQLPRVRIIITRGFGVIIQDYHANNVRDDLFYLGWQEVSRSTLTPHRPAK